MSLDVGQKQTISVCKRNRRSHWSFGDSKTERNTDIGMRMVVNIEKDSRGRKVSRTTYKKAQGE